MQHSLIKAAHRCTSQQNISVLADRMHPSQSPASGLRKALEVFCHVLKDVLKMYGKVVDDVASTQRRCDKLLTAAVETQGQIAGR